MATPSAPATKPIDAPKPERPPPGVRMPSLNQLAARINLNSNSTNSNSSSSLRPRLAASLLRTGSATSVSSTGTVSVADSTAVNISTTRSTSPATLSTSPPRSNTSTPVGSDKGEQLTAEKLEKLNEEVEKEQEQQQEQDAKPTERKKEKVPAGYKNIPSLSAITARLAKTRALSIDGTSKPPEPETIEDPKTPGLKIKAPEHPLEHTWTIYHDCKSKAPYTPATAAVVPPDSAHPMAPDTDEYEAGLTVIGECDTVESFCRYFNWLKPPSKLERNSNYHLFKQGIKPMWEDEANANGGKWVLTMKMNPELLDRCWIWLAMALIGEDLDDGDEICGAVVSLRSKVDRIQLWTRSKDDVEKINGIGKKMVKLLDVSEADGVGLEFQYNNDDRPTPNKFLSIQALPQTSYRSSFVKPNSVLSPTGPNAAVPDAPPVAATSSAPGGAFAGFGVGGGLGRTSGEGWRGKR
ncbi:translation initiation factor eIF 4e-like domain-containing protein [Cristinia sonorae]|uniref:Translation initiation factor eIF 4e-like domain-containing protein n=1 Tax=Cristinia sonorae TaxID=1940300 RepID=A0A8K0UQU8_9AGAR|nr:translation initiation factor eIF 4e-like domain-containing protein [Cristinia sonorae]